MNNRNFIDSFLDPPHEFGEVPFYWWTGDKLDKDRLTAQLTALKENGVAGVQINYAHMMRGGEYDEHYGGHGKSIPGDPVQFSEDWWEMFRHAAKECERLGLGIGVGDYTLAWIGNGFFTDRIAEDENANALQMSCEKKMLFSGDEALFGPDVLCAVSYPPSEDGRPVVLYDRENGVSKPVPGCCEVYVIRTERIPFSIDPLVPGCGDKLVSIYFEEFERRCPELKSGTLNYFFQDELLFGCDHKTLWRDTLRNGVREKYGYDVLGYLPHLFYDISDITPKIRLDVSDVRTALFEENYFKPVYHFHASRSMIYGCDQSGRGTVPDEFSDYFRTVRWFTAPGNDTPGRAADLIKVKVNSSVAHLYDRPRVWLEGYHSSGWGTTLESITAPTSDNFMFGANLLNLHGLYYSTNGGFFEWAPPDFHFRMPYWDDEKAWLLKYKRLAALLTAGVHRCDAALYYPVSSCEYGNNAETCVDTTFDLAKKMFAKGLDFDFIDFQSVERAVCSEGKLRVSSEEYKVLILAGVDCVRYSVIKKIKEFLDAGGAVVFYGITPYASDRAGLNDTVLLNDIEDVLTDSRCRFTTSFEDMMMFIGKKIRRSFLPEDVSGDKKTYVCQRVSGRDRLFFVRYADKDSVCRFEATATPYLLDAYTGKTAKIEGALIIDGFTVFRMPNEANEDTLILFTENAIDYEDVINASGFAEEHVLRTLSLDKNWNFSLIPTLDNRYGDFYLPAGGMIGAEARFFDVQSESGEVLTDALYNTDTAIRRVRCEDPEAAAGLFAVPGNEPEGFAAETQLLNARYGYIRLQDDSAALYEQGYHGLKGRVFDDNMTFDSDCVFFTDVFSEHGGTAYFRLTGYPASRILLNGAEVTDTAAPVTLKQGANRLAAAFRYDENFAPDYRNRGTVKRAGILLTKRLSPASTGIPLAKSDFANPDYLRFTRTDDSLFTFRFLAPPALESFTVGVFGTVTKALQNGVSMNVTALPDGDFGCRRFKAVCPVRDEKPCRIEFTVKADPGYEFTAAIPEPVRLQCGDFGTMDCGDLSAVGVLKNYSGKSVYSRRISVDKVNIDERFILDLGEVGATAEVTVNGKTAAVFTYAPFRKDVTDLIVNGENEIKITVSNTLCNHYASVPSRYSNFPQDAKSGLIGPVTVSVVSRSEAF